MYFLYKTKKLTDKNDNVIVSVELYDFILGKVDRFTFDDDIFISVEQQLHHKLKDVKMCFKLKEIK